MGTVSPCVFSLTLGVTSASVQPLLSNQFFFSPVSKGALPNPKTYKSWEVLSDSAAALRKLPLLSLFGHMYSCQCGVGK